MAQFGEKVWFRNIGEDCVSSFASRMTQGFFVANNSWTRQTLSDAWESTNWDGLCGTPWQLVAPELKLTKEVTADKEGATPLLPPHCQGLWLKQRRRLSGEDSAGVSIGVLWSLVLCFIQK